nr:hypothetical protein [Actinomycetota bacterium]
VSLHGALDLRASVRLGAILTDLIVGQGNLAVIVDLRDLGPVDAAAVDVFAASASAVELRGGTAPGRWSPPTATGAPPAAAHLPLASWPARCIPPSPGARSAVVIRSRTGVINFTETFVDPGSTTQTGTGTATVLDRVRGRSSATITASSTTAPTGRPSIVNEQGTIAVTDG